VSVERLSVSRPICISGSVAGKAKQAAAADRRGIRKIEVTKADHSDAVQRAVGRKWEVNGAAECGGGVRGDGGVKNPQCSGTVRGRCPSVSDRGGEVGDGFKHRVGDQRD